MAPLAHYGKPQSRKGTISLPEWEGGSAVMKVWNKPPNMLLPTISVAEQQFASPASLAHALIGLLVAIVLLVWHQWNERLFDHTSLPLDASHMIGLRGPSHELAEPKRFSHWRVH